MNIDTKLLDSLPDALLLVENGSVAWASGGAGRLLDCGPDTLVGRWFDAMLAPGESARLQVLDGQRRAGWDLPRPCRVRFVRSSDQAEIEADVWIDPVLGAPSTFMCCARNADAASRAEGLMGKLAELGSDPRAMLGADTLLDAAEPVFAALGWTGAFTEVLDLGSITRRILSPPGHPVGEYGRSLLGRVTPFDRTPILAEVVRTRTAVFLPNVPTLLPGVPSRAVPLGDSMARAQLTRSAWCPIVRDGRVTHLLSVTGRELSEHDMVSLRLFAAQIGAAIRMGELHRALVERERLAAIGEMAAVIAHEVRNPLSVIMNALGMLRHPLAGGDDAKTLLCVASDEAERLGRLVADLLAFAHPKEPSIEVFEIGPLIDEAVAAVRQDPSLPTASTATLEVSVPSTVPPVAADPIRLRRVLVNLLVNAFQHVPEHGRVRIAAERSSNAEVRLIVSNDGQPIPADVGKRVFDPFFTTRGSGTGLGLAVVRRIVEEVGGRVALDATLEGASFSCWLQTGTKEENQRAHVPPAAAHQAKSTPSR